MKLLMDSVSFCFLTLSLGHFKTARIMILYSYIWNNLKSGFTMSCFLSSANNWNDYKILSACFLFQWTFQCIYLWLYPDLVAIPNACQKCSNLLISVNTLFQAVEVKCITLLRKYDRMPFFILLLSPCMIRINNNNQDYTQQYVTTTIASVTVE